MIFLLLPVSLMPVLYNVIILCSCSSYAGACQLANDVKYLRRWLADTITHETVRQSIVDLTVLKTLQGAVMLLMKQPTKRPTSKFREANRDTSEYSKTSIVRAPIARACDILEYIGWLDITFFLSFCTHNLAVGAIFTSQNHPKCEFNSHFG